MHLTDPIADMLTRIRNALQERHDIVDIPASRVKGEIVRLLKDEGYISSYELLTKGIKKILRLTLKYRSNKKSVITTLKKISLPGRRVYKKRKEIYPVLGGFGITILSTPQGIITDREARRLGVGGEILCRIW